MSASTVANSLSAVCRRVSGRFLKSRGSIRSSGSFRTPRRRARVAGCRVKTARDKVHHAGVRFQATGLSEHEPHAARIRKRLHRLCTTCAEKALISPNIRAVMKRATSGPASTQSFQPRVGRLGKHAACQSAGSRGAHLHRSIRQIEGAGREADRLDKRTARTSCEKVEEAAWRTHETGFGSCGGTIALCAVEPASDCRQWRIP